jgi:hypothetical protein
MSYDGYDVMCIVVSCKNSAYTVKDSVTHDVAVPPDWACIRYDDGGHMWVCPKHSVTIGTIKPVARRRRMS